MDDEFFIEYFSLPIIEKIKRILTDSQGELNYKLTFLKDGFQKQGIRANEDLVLIIQKINFSNRVFEIVKLITEDESTNKFFDVLVESSNIEYSIPPKRISDEYIKYLDRIGVTKVLLDILRELDDLKIELNNKLAEKQEVENSFVSMI